MRLKFAKKFPFLLCGCCMLLQKGNCYMRRAENSIPGGHWDPLWSSATERGRSASIYNYTTAGKIGTASCEPLRSIRQ